MCVQYDIVHGGTNTMRTCIIHSMQILQHPYIGNTYSVWAGISVTNMCTYDTYVEYRSCHVNRRTGINIEKVHTTRFV
jgi:hypothetical protein